MPMFQTIWARLKSCFTLQPTDSQLPTTSPAATEKTGLFQPGLHGYDRKTVMDQLANPRLYTTAPKAKPEEMEPECPEADVQTTTDPTAMDIANDSESEEEIPPAP